MAIAFPRPDRPLRIRASTEIRALNKHFTARKVPKPKDGHLLLASWNIPNLGV